MHSIDWIFVIVPIAVVLAFAVYTKRYVKSVADFLSGGRCAGRYLLANARGESDAGLSNTMAMFERILKDSEALARQRNEPLAEVDVTNGTSLRDFSRDRYRAACFTNSASSRSP